MGGGGDWGVNTMTEHKHASMQHIVYIVVGKRGGGCMAAHCKSKYKQTNAWCPLVVVVPTPLVPTSPLRAVWKFEPLR